MIHVDRVLQLTIEITREQYGRIIEKVIQGCTINEVPGIEKLVKLEDSRKHGIEVETITKPTGEITFPIHFPLEIPVRRIIWKVKWDARSKRQEEMYLKHLDGKDVVSTCGEFIERLKKLKKV